MNKHSDNISGAEPMPVRRPGRPKGLPKPLGSGRQKGSLNRVTRDVKEASQAHGPKALKKLVELIANPDPRVALAASREILDRAYGRPVIPAEITSKGGMPVGGEREKSILEMARLMVFVLNTAEKEVEKEANSHLLQRSAQRMLSADPCAEQRRQFNAAVNRPAPT